MFKGLKFKKAVAAVLAWTLAVSGVPGTGLFPFVSVVPSASAQAAFKLPYVFFGTIPNSDSNLESTVLQDLYSAPGPGGVISITYQAPGLGSDAARSLNDDNKTIYQCHHERIRLLIPPGVDQAWISTSYVSVPRGMAYAPDPGITYPEASQSLSVWSCPTGSECQNPFRATPQSGSAQVWPINAGAGGALSQTVGGWSPAMVDVMLGSPAGDAFLSSMTITMHVSNASTYQNWREWRTWGGAAGTRDCDPSKLDTMGCQPPSDAGAPVGGDPVVQETADCDRSADGYCGVTSLSSQGLRLGYACAASDGQGTPIAASAAPSSGSGIGGVIVAGAVAAAVGYLFGLAMDALAPTLGGLSAGGCMCGYFSTGPQKANLMVTRSVATYLIAGEPGDMGAGLIGAIASHLEGFKTMAKVNGQGRQEEDQRWRLAKAQAIFLDEERAMRPDPADFAACSEVGSRSAFASEGAKGAMASSLAGKSMAEAAVDLRFQRSSEAVASADAYAIHAKRGYCSEQDAKNSDGSVRSAFGCSEEGPMPDADARVQSAFSGAGKFSGSSPDPQAMTFDDDNGVAKKGAGAQRKAAYDAISNIVAAFTPTSLAPEIEKSVAGRDYLAKAKVAKARLSIATHVLAGIAGRRDGSGNEAAAANKQDWDDESKGVYGRVFNGMPRPQKPSETDLMRFETYKRFADTEWQLKIATETTPKYQSRELARSDSVKLALMWNINERLEERTALFASLLAQQITPMTKAQLDALAEAAQKR